MAGPSRQAWVTSAVSYSEAQNALVLACSLKEAFTSRKLVVLLSRELSRDLVDILRHTFDLVLFIEEERKPTSMELGEFVKLSAIGIVGNFDKCIYLRSNSIAMQNPDNIFEEEISHFGDENSKLVNFGFRPSTKVYTKFLNDFHHNDVQGHQAKQYKVKVTIGELYPIKCLVVGGSGNDFVEPLGRKAIMPIVNFSGNFLSSYGHDGDFVNVLDKLVYAHWKRIFCQYVEPLVEKSSIALERISTLTSYSNEPIAVVGMACRLPGCKNLEEFWNLLFTGDEAVGSPPLFRWQRSQCSKASRADKIKAGFLSVPVDEFDARFFGISPKEALYMDPQHRLLLEVVWEALEDAFIDPTSLNGTNGSVYVGSWMEDYKDILRNSGNEDSFRLHLGVLLGSASARISHVFKLNGPSMATESGCASSMSGVHMACRALRLGETNLALATGVNLMLNPFDENFLPMVASVDGRCKTFCEKADYYARAEGCAGLVLKRLSDAVRDGDNIWALIRGSGVSQEGISSSMGTPTVIGESLAMKRALKDAHVNPEDVTYIELHGTGTPVGDPLEVSAIAKVYGTEKRETPLIIGSVKTNVGHTEACSGITGIIKTVLAMNYSLIPAHRNMEKLNPDIDLGSIPAVIPLEAMEWGTEDDKPKIAGVSSFGMSGTDSHVILEESPTQNFKNGLQFATEEFKRPLHVLKLSAKSETALSALIASAREEICLNSEEELADICYGGNTGRADFNWRAVATARSTEELAEKFAEGKLLRKEVSGEKGKICFLFTGQGSQYPGMARQLYETSPIFRIHFDHCEKILRSNYDIDIRKTLWGKDSLDELNRTIFSQTSIFCVEYALLKLLNSWGLSPDFVLGHSLGEFAAAVCAGILSLEDAVMLVAGRSRLINNLAEGRMLVLKASQEEVSLLLEAYFQSNQNTAGNKLDFAAVNSEEQTVVAGDSKTVTDFSRFCKNNGVKCTILGSSHAFHSSHMDKILDAYRNIAAGVKKPLQKLSCSFISGVQGRLISSKEMDPEYWVKHTREPVSFLDASQEAVKLGCKIFVEIGPQPVLSAFMAMNTSPDNEIFCMATLKRTEENWTTLLDTLSALYLHGVPINWKGFDQFYCRRKIRALPNYPFQRKKFWPENIQQEPLLLHPLLGNQISNASQIKLFRSVVELRTLEYLRDHAIGKHAIFPGCGYLEMVMAAGVAATSSYVDSLPKAIHSMKVEDLLIKAPLLLDEQKKCELQTVLQFQNSGDCSGEVNVQICKRVGSNIGDTPWRQHAEARFFTFTSAEDRAIPFDTVEKFREMVKRPGNEEIPSQYYEHLALEGLAFGSEFRSLQKMWRNKEGTSTLVKIKRPIQEKQLNGYIAHPTVLDAMAQSPLLLKFALHGKVKMLVSLKIGKFVWLGTRGAEDDLYVYTYDTQDDEEDEISTSSYVLILLNGEGKALAVMSGLECAHTTVRRVEMALEQQTTTTPDMWEEVWRPSPKQDIEHKKLELDEVGTRVRTPLWLLFHHEKSPMSKSLLEEMSANSEIRILVVTHSEEVVVSIGKCTIRKNLEDDFTRIFENVVGGDSCIGGVVYCWTLDEAVSSQEEILQPYLYLVKSLINLKQDGSIRLLSLFKNAVALEGSSPVNFHQSTIWGFVKTVQSEHPELTCRCIDIGDMEDDKKEKIKIFDEIWNFGESDDSAYVAYKNGIRYIPKFQAHIGVARELRLPPGTDRFQLSLPDSRAIDDLQFISMEEGSISPREVEVLVKAAALNFRDIMVVLKPTEYFSKINGIGTDIAGVVRRVGAKVRKWCVGDYVFAQNIQDSPLPSHAILHEDDVYRMEKDMSWCEAATFPVVFLTAYVGLIETAKIRKGDTVLVHSGSGGVGLCAIQICKNIGAKVICTAGSTRKKSFLKSLGVDHIFNSRNINYSKEILEVTGRRGVDVVLNSLTSEGFKEATLLACAPGARFVEMSKFNVWTAEEVRQLRPDVDYKVIDVSVGGLEDSHRRKIINILVDYIREKRIVPLPYQRFDGINIREALHFLQKAKHIGKVVCVMPEFELSPKSGVCEVDTPIFHRQGTYLITGGRVGSIGFEVCQWMVKKGAKYVLLVTRTAPTESAQQTISKLNAKYSSSIISVQVDLGDYSQLEELVQRKLPQMGLPQLKGVMHCAGVISDGLVQNQSWSSLRVPLRAKVDGTLNLHRVTSGINLEHFVIFSSLAALFGLPGQSNHGAANNFEDVFAHYRHSLGLPATSINWGLWAEVGIGKEVEIPGLKPMSSRQGISGLEYALKSHRAQIAIANFDSFLILSKRTPQVATYLDERLWKPKAGNTRSGANMSSLVSTADDFWRALDLENDSHRKRIIIQDQLKLILRNVLKLDNSEEIGAQQNFEELGVDSLMYMEIGNAVRTLLGKKVTVKGSALRDSNNIEELTIIINNLIG